MVFAELLIPILHWKQNRFFGSSCILLDLPSICNIRRGDCHVLIKRNIPSLKIFHDDAIQYVGCRCSIPVNDRSLMIYLSNMMPYKGSWPVISPYSAQKKTNVTLSRIKKWRKIYFYYLLRSLRLCAQKANNAWVTTLFCFQLSN